MKTEQLIDGDIRVTLSQEEAAELVIEMDDIRESPTAEVLMTQLNEHIDEEDEDEDEDEEDIEGLDESDPNEEIEGLG